MTPLGIVSLIRSFNRLDRPRHRDEPIDQPEENGDDDKHLHELNQRHGRPSCPLKRTSEASSALLACCHSATRVCAFENMLIAGAGFVLERT